jgi:hypothetical protein
MLTLFPTPSLEPKKTQPHPIPRRLQFLPLGMLAIAAMLQLAAWHRNNVSHAAPTPSRVKLSAVPPSPPIHPLSKVPQPSAAELAREAQKAREAKTRSLQLYTNPDYAISLSYPRSYILKESSELADEDNTLLQQRTDGSPNQKLLARIELPDNLYPRTDFLAAYLSLSVNPKLTAEQCAQSIGVEEEATAITQQIDGIAFRGLQTASDAGGTHNSLREYSAFSSGACYELELGVVTLNDGSIARVSQDRVFHRLEAILRTIKITDPK